MIAIGQRHTLPVSRESVHGYYLDAGERGEILLPTREAPAAGLNPDDPVDVFLYRDSQDRLVATTAAPKAMVGQFALLPVVSVNRQIGAFLDWGLPKDLLLPFREQREPVCAGDRVVVYIHLDAKSDRIIATTRLNKHLSREQPPFSTGQPVQALVFGRTPLGCTVIVNGAYSGLLYHTNLAAPLDVGQELTAYVGAIRPDGKLDLLLDPAGYQRVATLTTRILDALEKNAGQLPFDDQSSPESIREAFGVSKKAFKQAIGALYKDRRIRFEPPGIRLVPPKPARSRR